MSATSNTTQQFLDFARQVALTAESAILPHFHDHVVSFKSDGSEVTVADRQGEQVMRQSIQQTYPDHEILGEEFGESAAVQAGTDSRYRW
ncbi:MAG: inositol phosphatase, partial [Cyanothece sp. SIO2G6]|nr:inositol phosphatase [Cyanothece sp. SIO2G6]